MWRKAQNCDFNPDGTYDTIKINSTLFDSA